MRLALDVGSDSAHIRIIRTETEKMTFREIALEAYRVACAKARKRYRANEIDSWTFNELRWKLDAAYAKRDEMASRLGAW